MKNTSYIILILLLNSLFAFSQQIPFQGKLLENGTPVNGQRNFTLSINIGNINWIETQNNVTVTNGLYALVPGQNTPLPSNLFEDQNSIPLTIQVNGQSLPNTTIYAPFESDPNVPDNLKDGVSWEEVSNKPSLDESDTNELQTLNVDGNNLSISDGNTVSLSSTNQGDSLTIGNVDTVAVTALEQLTFDGTSTRNFLWQSFSINQNAKLKAIEIEFANSINIDIRFRLYPQEGINQQFLWSNDFAAANYGPTLEIQSFPISDFTDIDLNAGELYTFYVQGIGDDLLFRKNDSNPYDGGISNISSTTDAIFRIIVETIEGYTLEVTPDQTTIRTPLTVEDRIRDKSGLVMPVGTVLSYAGASVPDGWLLCDGSEVNRDLYPDLFTAIGTAWGTGDGVTTFHLPDLRGQFLRGVSGSTSEDPNRNNRNAKYSGGNTGNNVGSYQEDIFKSHNHVSNRFDSGNQVNNIGTGSQALGWSGSYQWTNSLTVLTGETGGSETRPKNAYVNYIIKY
ncbi:MAG: tail fiber protein [Bacteroidota bacterium]